MVLLCFGQAFGQPEKSGRILGRYLVKSVRFDFVGKRTYKDKKLQAKLSFKRGDNVDAIQAGFGREDLAEFYVQRGFAFVEVNLDQAQLSQGHIVYTIKEGPRVRIAKVRFDGNKSVRTGTLKKNIKMTKKKWFFWSKDYTEELVTEDVEKLEDIYEELGYLDRKVTARTDLSKDQRKAYIVFAIDEGPAYVVDNIVLAGGERIYDVNVGGQLDEQSLLRKLKLKAGNSFRKQTAESDRRGLLKVYRQYGFIDAEVELHVDRVLEAGGIEPASEGKVNIEFVISAGRQFRIGRIDIIGNRQTQDKVIRRVLDSHGFEPGRWYNAEAARGTGTGELEKEIRLTALTDEAIVTPLASAQEGQKNVEVLVKERQTGMWMLGAGVSSDRGLIGSMVWQQRNFDVNDSPESLGELITGEAFKGGGQSLRIALQPGTEMSEYSVDFSEPYFRDDPLSLGIGGSSWEWERESYDEGRARGYFGFSERYEKRYAGRWRKSIDFRGANVDVDDIDIDAPREIREVEGDNALLGLKFGLAKDVTDDRFYPGEGYRFKSNYEQVTGEHTFGIISATLRQFRTVHRDLAERRTILLTKIHAGRVVGDAPPFEKFYAGGMQSIRGFDFRGVSTRGKPEINGVPVAGAEVKDPIGSDWVFLANAELVVPLVSEELSWLFFVDSGTVDSGKYRASVGTGIQLMIPQWFGPVPMRFGVAAPFMKDNSDETEAFFFYAGQFF
jgi:outer membrane protein insertion porin family